MQHIREGRQGRGRRLDAAGRPPAMRGSARAVDRLAGYGPGREPGLL